MNRRAIAVLGWSASWLATSLLTAPTLAVELRGRGAPRGVHRVAALQIDDEFRPGTVPPIEAPSVDVPEEEATDPPTIAPPKPSVRRATPPRTPSPAPQPSPPPVKTIAPAHPYTPPMTEPMWDAGVQGGPCSDGYCEECPTYGGMGCNGGWGSVDYVLWWRDQRRTPILVTTSDVDGRATDARLGQADTTVLLGPDQFDDHLQPGGRFDIGMWFDSCQSVGAGLRVTFLADDELNYITTSATNPVLAVPFFNLDPLVNREDTLLVAHPDDGSTGSISVTGNNEVTLGDLYVRIVGARTDGYRVDILAGYGFSTIHEDLSIRTQTTTGGASITVRDRFYAKNHYNGGMLGLSTEIDRGPYKVNVLAKVGLMNAEQEVIVDGITTIGGVVQGPLGGLFAQPSNSGTISRNHFAVVPELGLNYVHRVGCNASITAGYSLVYWSDVARPGDQINRRIDPTQATSRPAQQIISDDYLAQGFNFGVAWDY